MKILSRISSKTFHLSHDQQLQTNNNFGTGQINSEPCVLIPETPTQYTFSVNKITGIFFCNGQDLAKSQLLFPVHNLY